MFSQRHHPQQRRLAAAVSTNHKPTLPGSDLEVDVGENVSLAPRKSHMAQFHQGVTHV
jgi:hypothetical protein